MSIAVLTEVYNETRRLAIAGSGLANGDFRLKKLVAPLEKAGAKAPVFGKVAQAIQKVVESDGKSASESLLELSTLVSAILYTQGKTGMDGKLKPIESSNFKIPTSESSARILKPLIEALTTTGSGRMEIIQDAFNRGAFKDLRLVKPAVAAIDDVYGEIGEFISKNVLPMYGKAILPELRETFEVKGRGGHVRRLKLLHELDPEGTHDLVEQALESGSKEMKVAAIWCLKDSKGHLSYMLEQVRAKAKDVRKAAFNAIAGFKDSSVVDALVKGLSGKDLDVVIGPVSENRSPKVLNHLLEESEKQLNELLTTKSKAKQKSAMERFHQLLGGFVSRDDKKSEKFLIDCFGKRDQIARLKDGNYDGEAINDRVAVIMVRSNSKAAQHALVEVHETLPASSLSWAFVAGMRTRKPKEVFDLFSPYYAAKLQKKRGRNPAREKQEVMQRTLCEITQGKLHRHARDLYDEFGLDHSDFVGISNDVELASEWLDAAIEIDDLVAVRFLAEPNHKPTIEYLSTRLQQLLDKSGDQDYEIAEIIDTMIRIKHPKFVDHFVAALEKTGKRSKRYYYAWWLVRLTPGLPKSAVPKIEAILPSLNGRLVDEIIPYIEQLKQK